MRNAIIGIIIGIVIGVVAGATVVAPRLTQDATRNAAVPLKTLAALPVSKTPPTPAKRKVEEEAEKVPERDKRHPPFPEQVELPIAPPPPKAAPKDTDNPAEKAEEKENENGAAPPAEKTAGKTAAEKPTAEKSAGAPPPKKGSETKAKANSQADSEIQEVAAVPIQAIIFEEDRSELRSEYFIFVNDNGIARKTKVEVGLSDDEYQELMSEIGSNVEIVIGPNQELRHLLEGDRIDTTVIEI